MSKKDVTFFIVCAVIVVAVLGVYGYNKKSMQTVSVMQVVPLESISDGINEYSMYKSTTAISDSANPTDDIYNAHTDVASTGNTSITTTPNTTTSTTTTTSLSDITSTKSTTTSKSTTTTHSTESSVTFPISLNAITHDELVLIKGIGDVTASKIIAYREQIGYYTSRYQLLEIDGIGESKMQTIMEYTYIENEDLTYGQETEDDYQAEVYFGGDAIQENPQINSSLETTQLVNEITPIPLELTTTTQIIPVNLNTATYEELCDIPSLNEDLAKDILDLRQTIGCFSDIYELLYVDGISEKTLTEISDYVSIQ